MKSIDGLAYNARDESKGAGDEPVSLDNTQKLRHARFVVGLVSEHFNVACEELGFWTKNGLKPHEKTINQIKHFFDGHKTHAERFVNFLNAQGAKEWDVLGEFGNAKKDMQETVNRLEY